MSDERTIKPNDPADFTPQLGNYKSLQPFRFWCQKVLPLVYDDSLSYYELLCKVVDYLNKTMEDVETLNGDVTNLHKAYVQLQEYVNNYFNTLDVQEEINNKLDEMVENGTLMNLFNKYIPYTTPERFGAIGDGITDDSISLQNCINYAIQNNLAILLSKVYACKGLLASSRIFMYGTGTPVSGFYDLDGSQPLLSVTGDYSVLCNFYVHSITSRSTPCFEIYDSHSVILEKLWFNGITAEQDTLNAPTVKIYLKTPGDITYLTRIVNCKFIYATVYLQSTDSIIVNSIFNGLYKYYALHLYNASNTIISNNEIVSGANCGLFIDGSYNVTGLKIASNYFDGGGSTQNTNIAIRCGKPLLTSLINANNFWRIHNSAFIGTIVRQCIFSNNVFEDCSFIEQTEADIDISGNSFSNVFNGNMFYRVNYYNKDTMSVTTRTLNGLPLALPNNTSNFNNMFLSNTIYNPAYYTAINYSENNIYESNNSTSKIDINSTFIPQFIKCSAKQLVAQKNLKYCAISGAITITENVSAYEALIGGLPNPLVQLAFYRDESNYLYLDINGYLHTKQPIESGTTIPLNIFYLLK